MSFQTDSGGVAFKCDDIKLCAPASTWATKLSQFHRQRGIVRIITYSLPDMDYVRAQFQKRSYGIFLIAHSRFFSRAQEVKRAFPTIRIAVHSEVHSKVLLVAPHTIYISSANFGSSGWHETSIGLHSQIAHDWYVQHMFDPLWTISQEVE